MLGNDLREVVLAAVTEYAAARDSFPVFVGGETTIPRIFRRTTRINYSVRFGG